MPLRAIVVAALAATILAAGVPAAAGQEDPLALILPVSQVPGAKVVGTGRGPADLQNRLAKQLGVRPMIAYYGYDIPTSETASTTVTGMVISLPNAAQARKVYSTLRERMRALKGAAIVGGAPRRFGGPTLTTYIRGAGADALVRHGAFVWSLSIRLMGSTTQSRQRTLSQLSDLGTKQQRRIARG
jgi:hypothetical protein